MTGSLRCQGRRIIQASHLAPRLPSRHLQRHYSSDRPTAGSPAATAGVTDEEVQSARAYCSNLLSNYDHPSHTLRAFIPAHLQDAYVALCAFNVDVARIADATSNPAVGAMRMQFWRDAVTRALALSPPKEPVAILIAHAAAQLARQSNGRSKLSKSWLLRIINTREQYLSSPPYADLAALETYAENTYSTLLYLNLAAVPLASIAADHVASHIGKAQGIATVLRGLPLLAFPAPPNHHSNQAGAIAQGFDLPQASRHGVVTLPLDIMAANNVREEEVLRNGSAAPGVRDAVFAVATRANDHLITAREMVRNLRAGKDAGHAFEHQDDPERSEQSEHARRSPHVASIEASTPRDEIEAAFGVYMQAVAVQSWLDRLQAVDFDVFSPHLLKADWKLPWRAYWAWKKRTF